MVDTKLGSCLLVDNNYREPAHFQVADLILFLDNNLDGRDSIFFSSNIRHHLSYKAHIYWIVAIPPKSG